MILLKKEKRIITIVNLKKKSITILSIFENKWSFTPQAL